MKQRWTEWFKRSVPFWLFAAGITLVAASLLPGTGFDDAWSRDVLMTVGSSVALFGPFFYLTRSLNTHFDDVTERVRIESAERDAARAQDVQDLRDEVERRLDDVAASVKTRLDAEADADRGAFSGLRTTTSREALVDALRRAKTLRLIGVHHHPRVRVSQVAELYVSFEFHENIDSSNTWLTLRLENLHGSTQDQIQWTEDASEDDVLVDVGRALRGHTNEAFDPTELMCGLADLLEAALSHPERRPAVQLCPPQWMVCDRRVVPYNAQVVDLTADELRQRPDLHQNMTKKPWVDSDSLDEAVTTVLSLYPSQPRADPPW